MRAQRSAVPTPATCRGCSNRAGADRAGLSLKALRKDPVLPPWLVTRRIGSRVCMRLPFGAPPTIIGRPRCLENLSGTPTDPFGVGQPLRAHLQRDAELLADHAAALRLYVTPTHGSWLNLIENQFSKMTRTMLRGIRVASKQELIDRIHQYFEEINADPVVFRWKYKMDEVSIDSIKRTSM